jgi:hypothetical protein
MAFAIAHMNGATHRRSPLRGRTHDQLVHVDIFGLADGEADGRGDGAGRDRTLFEHDADGCSRLRNADAVEQIGTRKARTDDGDAQIPALLTQMRVERLDVGTAGYRASATAARRSSVVSTAACTACRH